MKIAQQLKEKNIAEYLIYMWQVEDLMRANGCDIDRIQDNIINRYDVDENTRKNIRDWYENLLKMMELEGVKKEGHLQINKNVIIRLNDFHNALLDSTKFPEYRAEYYKTLPYIVELRAKSGENPAGEIETCFNALYMTLMMRLQHKELSKGTSEAILQISHFIAKLSALYMKDEQKPIIDNDEEIV